MNVELSIWFIYFLFLLQEIKYKCEAYLEVNSNSTNICRKDSTNRDDIRSDIDVRNNDIFDVLAAAAEIGINDETSYSYFRVKLQQRVRY